MEEAEVEICCFVQIVTENAILPIRKISLSTVAPSQLKNSESQNKLQNRNKREYVAIVISQKKVMRYGIKRFRGLKTHQILFAGFLGFTSGLYIWTPLAQEYGEHYLKRKEEVEQNSSVNNNANKTS